MWRSSPSQALCLPDCSVGGRGSSVSEERQERWTGGDGVALATADDLATPSNLL